MLDEKHTAIDLFCGCGGFSLGLIQAGFDVRLGIDMDFDALHTYCANLSGPGLKWYGQKPNRKYLDKWFKDGFPPFDKRSDKTVGWSHTVRAIICDDIRRWHGLDILHAAELETVDLVVGSPPCQSFSKSGRRIVGDTRDFLMFEMIRVILEMNPKSICLENVPDIMTKNLPDGRNIVELTKQMLKDKDWELYYELRDKYQPNYPDPIDIEKEMMEVARR